MFVVVLIVNSVVDPEENTRMRELSQLWSQDLVSPAQIVVIPSGSWFDYKNTAAADILIH